MQQETGLLFRCFIIKRLLSCDSKIWPFVPQILEAMMSEIARKNRHPWTVMGIKDPDIVAYFLGPSNSCFAFLLCCYLLVSIYFCSISFSIYNLVFVFYYMEQN